MTGCWLGLWLEVEVLDDERTSTLAVVKDLGECLTSLSPGIPVDRLPAFRRKRQGKGGSDGQLELSFEEFD